MTTLNDYLDNGYHLSSDMTYQRGYVPRGVDIGDQIVHEGKGARAGQLYILVPSYTSSRYCFRQYLRKGER